FTSAGTPFSSEEACVSYAARGGTLVSGVDASVTFTKPSSESSFTDGGDTGDVKVHNGGTLGETINVSINESSALIEAERWNPVVASGCTATFTVSGASLAWDCTVTVAAGATMTLVSLDASGDLPFLGPVHWDGTASITSATLPDPNTSN